MLVLTRRKDERIIITDRRNGTTLTICVHQIRERAVKLAIEAPLYMTIRREELPELDRDRETEK